MKKNIVIISLVCLTHLFAVRAHSATYNYFDIYVPGSITTSVSDINDAGQVVGIHDSGSGHRGFIFDGTNYTTDVSFNNSGTLTRFYGINNNGVITGEYMGADFTGLSYDGTTWTSLEVQGAARTDPRDINDAGQIVGWNRDTCYIGGYGFLYDGSSSWTRLAYPGTNSPLCAGWGSGGGNDSTTAMGINNSGVVVGMYSLSGTNHGFIYDNGSWSTVDYPSASNSRILGINDAGDIIGSYKDAGGNWHAYTGNINDMGSFSEFLVPGSTSTSLSGINNNGDLVGSYNNGSGNVAFMAIVPEPISSTLFLIGGATLGFRRFRKKINLWRQNKSI